MNVLQKEKKSCLQAYTLYTIQYCNRPVFGVAIAEKFTKLGTDFFQHGYHHFQPLVTTANDTICKLYNLNQHITTKIGISCCCFKKKIFIKVPNITYTVYIIQYTL